MYVNVIILSWSDRGVSRCLVGAQGKKSHVWRPDYEKNAQVKWRKLKTKREKRWLNELGNPFFQENKFRSEYLEYENNYKTTKTKCQT